MPYIDSWLITYDEILALWIWHKTTVGPYTVDQFLKILAFLNLFFQPTKLETVNLLLVLSRESMGSWSGIWEIDQNIANRV